MDDSVLFPSHRALLSDPFLQFPDDTSVSVVWFTAFAGTEHAVEYGADLDQIQPAITTRLSRMREDADSWVGAQQGDGSIYGLPVRRNIWRHEARVSGLESGRRIPYRVVSRDEDNRPVASRVFSLSARPERSQHVRILLTSDHQIFPATTINLEKAKQTAGHLDAVLLAGDLVNVADRASEWFDDSRGVAFFPRLQGNAATRMSGGRSGEVYSGGEIIQHTPLYPVIGNHDVMGRFSMVNSLNFQSVDTRPRTVAEGQYEKCYGVLFNPAGVASLRRQWIEDNSFNTVTFEEIFSLPRIDNEHGLYYSQRIGDVYLIALCVARAWRRPSLELDKDVCSAYLDVDVTNPATWGYGAHFFESIARGSEQYKWLISQVETEDFQSARCRIVMLHHSFHSLGLDVIPPFSDPVQTVTRDSLGAATRISYEYPAEQDCLVRDLQPVLQEAGFHLVLSGHNHLWNRFVDHTGVNYLETSSVGNTHGAYWLENKRGNIPPEYLDQFIRAGDPNGLQPVIPNIRPLSGPKGEPLPYVADNNLSTFSLLDTQNGTVSSYYVDIRQPSCPAVKFDEFSLT